MEPCIYCHSQTAEVIDADETRGLFTVCCLGCGMTGPVATSRTAAINNWNALAGLACRHCIKRAYGQKMLKRLDKIIAKRWPKETPNELG